MPYPMFAPNFKILGAVVPEKYLAEKNVTTQRERERERERERNIVTEKTKTIYSLYTSYAWGIIKELTTLVGRLSLSIR